MKKNIFLALALILILTATYFTQNPINVDEDLIIPGDISQTEPAPIEIGGLAPNFVLPNVSGKSVNLVDYRGKPTIVFFWATTCNECVDTMKELEQVFERDGAMVLAVQRQGNTDQATVFANNNLLTYPILIDEPDRMYSVYDGRGLPATYLIDEDGFIQNRWAGPLTKEEIETALEALNIDKKE